MKELPIIFTGESVRAILDGKKTMTRRVIEPQPQLYHDGALLWTGKIPRTAKYYEEPPHGCFAQFGKVIDHVYCRYGPGSLLWVREKTGFYQDDRTSPRAFRADVADAVSGTYKWIAATFMPRAVSRITLEVTSLRVERLQDITVSDIDKEGFQPALRPGFDVDIDGMLYDEGIRSCREQFGQAWDEINGKKHPWNSNPWVWVIEFKKVTA